MNWMSFGLCSTLNHHGATGEKKSNKQTNEPGYSGHSSAPFYLYVLSVVQFVFSVESHCSGQAQ